MIQQVILICMVFLVLYQIGVIRFDPVTSFLTQSGYESDDDAEYYKKPKRRRKKRRKQTYDQDMTPLSEILQKRYVDREEDSAQDPEDIQAQIMSELNKHDGLILTPAPI